MNTRHSIRVIGISVAALIFCLVRPVWADDVQDLKKDLEQLREQNRLMQQQLEQQQKMIDQLNRKVNELQPSAPPAAGAAVAPSVTANADLPAGETAPKAGNGYSIGNVKISGEGGVGFFETG